MVTFPAKRRILFAVAENVKRGRPPNLRRRGEILEAAQRAFGRCGYYGTSLRAIAREAGISGELLRRYFRTKDDILEAFREQAVDVVDELVAAIARADEPESGLLAYLHAVALAYERFVRKIHHMYVLWLMNPEAMEPYSETLKDYIGIVRRVVAAALERRVAATEPRIRAAVNVLFASLFWTGLTRERLGLVTDFSIDQAVTVAATFLRADDGAAV